MIVRPCAQFKTTIPEDGDGEEPEDGKPYAAAVSIALSELLNSLGYEADPPEYTGFLRWEFEVRIKGYPTGSRALCTVGLIADYNLVFENMTWGWRGKARKRYPQPYIDALRDLGRAMQSDPRFFDLRWGDTPDDTYVVGRAAPDPVDPA